MATVNILGRSYEIAPYKFGVLKKAAPHIDAINETAGALTTLEGMMESFEHSVAIVALGLQKHDATLTVEFLESELGMDDLVVVSKAVTDILRESGLATSAGEAPAPFAPEPEPEGALESSSETSSAS